MTEPAPVDPRSPGGLASRWFIVPAVVVGALLLSLTEVSQLYIRGALEGWVLSLRHALARALTSWFLLAALVPGMLFMAQRWRLDRPARGRIVVAHLLASLLIMLVHVGGTAFVVAGTSLPPHPYREVFGYLLVAYFAIDLMLYWAVVGGAHAAFYYRASRERDLVASRLEGSLHHARLNQLRAQLNPHFLFNSLNAVSTLALEGEKDQVVDALDRLGTLLRRAVDADAAEEITLAEELSFIDSYLELHRLRFPDRLRVQREIDPGALEALVPTMILQPLVENALVHGIARFEAPGLVCIRARREGGVLLLQVEDSGPGFTDSSPGTGVGLSNTRARLEQLYGPRQRLTARPLADRGALVEIAFPFMVAPNGAGAGST